MTTHWTFVDTGISAIVRSKPDTSVFDSNSSQSIAINQLLLDGVALGKNISAELKYDPDKPNARLFQHLQANVETLDGIFQRLNQFTASELEMLADEISALATAPSSASDPNAVKAAGKKVAQSAFGNAQELDKPISQSEAALRTALKMQIQIQ